MGIYFFFSMVLGVPFLAAFTVYDAIVSAFESAWINIESIFGF